MLNSYRFDKNILALDNIMSLWNFDGSGTTLLDSVGNRPGAMTGSIAVNQAGKVNEAWDFGSLSHNKKVTCSGDPLSPTDFTVCAWIYSSSTGTKQYFIDNRDKMILHLRTESEILDIFDPDVYA